MKELRDLSKKHQPASTTAMVGAVDSLNQNAFHVAAEVGDPDILKTLIKLVIPAKLSALINARDAGGATPIFVAVRSGCKHVIREMAKAGADLSLADTNGNSAWPACVAPLCLHHLGESLFPLRVGR